MRTTMGFTRIFVVLAICAQCISSPLWGPVFVYQRPLEAMVDITNDLGIAVLQDHVSSRSNFAFSPYGVASVLVLLYEGSRGESARQIHNALRFPWQRDVTRIGFRDIHRHLRTYFSHEGYLSGITLSKSNTSLLPEYQRVLRFYGYDVSLGNPMKPKPPSDELPPPMTSAATTTDSAQNTTESSTVSTNSTDSPEMTTDEITTTVNPNAIMREEMTTNIDETTTESLTTMTDESEISTKVTEVMSNLMMSDGNITDSPVSMEMKSTKIPEDTTTIPDNTETPQGDMDIIANSTTEAPNMGTAASSEGTTMTKSTTDSKPLSEMTTTLKGTDKTTGMGNKDDSDNMPKTTFTSITPQMDESTTESSSIATSPPKITTSGMATVTETMTTLADTTTKSATVTTSESTPDTKKVSTSSEAPLVTTPQEPTNFPEEFTTTSTAATTLTAIPVADIDQTTSFEDVQTTSTDSSTDIPATTLDEENSTLEPQETTPKDIPTTIGSTVTTNRVTESPTTAKNPAITSDLLATTQATKTTTEDDIIKRKNDKLRPVLKVLGGSDDPAESRADAEDVTMQTTDNTEGTTPEMEDVISTTEAEDTTEDGESTTIEPNTEVEENVTIKDEAKDEKEDLSKPSAIQVDTLVDASSANNTDDQPLDRRKRAIRDPGGLGYPDISLQLQNGMYGSHVSRADAMFTQLPRFPFLIDGVSDELVPVMSYTATFPFAFIPRLHSLALEFPLDDERYKLLIILPVERRGLKQLIYDLSSCPLREVYESLKPTRVHAVIPSFMVEGFVILTSTLQQLGIWDVFDPRRSDLSGMSSDPELYVRNIEQSITVVIRNYVEIVDIQTRTMAARSQTERFEATHPFLYFVMDSETHVSLMAGKIIDPLNSRIY